MLPLTPALLCLMIAGCQSVSDNDLSQEKRTVYHVVVREILNVPSAKVVASVKRAVAAAQLETISRTTTNLDGLFHVQTALRKEFKIVVEAVAHDKTRLEISAVDRSDREMGRILFDRIAANR